MYQKNFLAVVSGTLLILSTISCGGLRFGNGEETGEAGSDDTFSDTLLKGVTEITFDSNNTASVDLGDVHTDDTYIVALYSYDDDGDTYAYQLGTADGESSLSSPTKLNALRVGDDSPADLHFRLRELEKSFEGDPNRVTPSTVKAATKAASVGSVKSFKVLNNLSSGSSYDVVTAELRYATSNFYAYVDVRNEDDMTDDDLEEILGPFEELVNEERNMFGDESDVNGDGHFAVLFTQAVNELGASGGGIITGFFYGADLYDSSAYAVSNEMEIIYTMVPDSMGEYGTPISKAFAMSNILPGVMPHEFQHMISYNMHVFENDGSQEEAWLNEGLSHLAEDIYSLAGVYMTETGIDNPSRVSYYLDSTDVVCFTCGSSLSQRGGSYLFARYLYEQAEEGNLSGIASGIGLIRRLLDTDKTGVENILDAALQTSDVDGFKFLLGRFSLAVYLSDTGLTSDSRYQFDGISLRGAQNDNRGTVLDGPVVSSVSSFPFTGSIMSSGLSFTSISGGDIMDNGGTLPVAISTDMQGGGFLVELNAVE